MLRAQKWKFLPFSSRIRKASIFLFVAPFFSSDVRSRKLSFCFLVSLSLCVAIFHLRFWQYIYDLFRFTSFDTTHFIVLFHFIFQAIAQSLSIWLDLMEGAPLFFSISVFTERTQLLASRNFCQDGMGRRSHGKRISTLPKTIQLISFHCCQFNGYRRSIEWSRKKNNKRVETARHIQ